MTEQTQLAELLRLEQQILEQAAEIESLRIGYDAACMLVAQLHEAVMGEVVGTHHGVVEDVRNKVAEQAAQIEVMRNALQDAEGALSEARDYPITLDLVIEALYITPSQALSQYRNDVLEEAAVICEKKWRKEDSFDSYDNAKAIRAMKG